MSNEFLAQYESKPVEFLPVLKEHGVSTTMIAKYLGFSYTHTSGVLHGIYRMMPDTEKKLRRLTDRLVKGENVNLKRLMLKPSKYKIIMKKHKVSIATLAHYLGKSYPYTCRLINGYMKVPGKIEQRLDDLVRMLEEEGGNC